jgi:hypothetical protein
MMTEHSRGIRDTGQDRIFQILSHIATTGQATALDHAKTRSDHHLLRCMEKLGWIEIQLVPVVRNVKIGLLQLTAPGNAFCHEKGWQVIESEWSRMMRLHQVRNGSDKHTGAVLWFAFQARRRGWHVDVMPEFGDPFIKPDMLLTKKGQVVLGEVETKARSRFEKWNAIGRLAADRYAILGICSTTPFQRSLLARECQRCGVKGMATDLQSISKGDDHSLLWLQNWDAV